MEGVGVRLAVSERLWRESVEAVGAAVEEGGDGAGESAHHVLGLAAPWHHPGSGESDNAG